MNGVSDAQFQDSQLNPESLMKSLKLENFNLVMGYHAVAIFIYSLWSQNQGKFSENDLHYIGNFGSYLEGDPASICDWGDSYLLFVGEITVEDFISGAIPFKNFMKFKPISPMDAFQIMKMDCLVHFNNYGFEFPELIERLNQMEKDPNSCKREWELWMDAISRAAKGELCGYE